TKFILQFIIKEEKKCFLVELDKDFSLNYFSFLENTEKIYFNTQNYKELFALKENKIFLLNLKKNETEKKFLLKNISAFNICNKDIYYLDNSGFLFKTDFSFKKKEILNKTPLSLKDTANYEIKIFGDFIFIQEENIFYLFEPKEHLFKKFFEPINIIKISPDAKKIVFCSEHEIWLLFLKEQLDQPQKKAGQEIFIARFSKKINDCLWLNNDYLIFTSENIIKITEIDDRNKINIISFDEFSSLKEKKLYKIFWNQNNKKLYILNEKKLFVSEKLIK
ncbi:MAG: hypothetical protein U9P88_02000, partial [Patescibacteria group bacterium]|nr:hypothetical protein [Patescibacteria group bacterium]